VVVLVDGMDGYAQTQALANLEALLKPLLNTYSLIAHLRMTWVFFLPDQAQSAVENSGSYKRGSLQPVSVYWDANTLQKFLHSRLEWASEDAIKSFIQLVDGELRDKQIDVVGQLIDMAQHHRLGPPRALLDLCGKLFAPSAQPRLSRKEWVAFHRAIQPDLPDEYLQWKVLSRYDKSDRALMGGVINRLTREQLESVVLAQTAVANDVVREPDAQAFLRDVNDTVEDLVAQNQALSYLRPTLERIHGEPSLDVKHKLVFAIPLLPFLTYNFEIEFSAPKSALAQMWEKFKSALSWHAD